MENKGILTVAFNVLPILLHFIFQNAFHSD